jgi:large repetitive protein
MIIRRKNTLLCAMLTISLAALLIQGAAFADGLTFGRETLQNKPKHTGDFNLQNRFSLMIDGVTAPGAPHTIEGIQSGPETHAVVAGSSVTFTADSGGGTITPTSYQWRKMSVSGVNFANIAGATGASYTISSVKSSDAGTYTVIGTYAGGSAFNAGYIVLTVTTATGAPAFTVQPRGQSARAASSVTFTASAHGSPTPTYQWKKNGVLISGATGTSYTISSVKSSDAGTYTVVAANSIGHVTSTGAVLKVTISLR